VRNDDGSDPMQLYPWAILEYVGEHSTLYHPHCIDGLDRVLSNLQTTPPTPPQSPQQQLYFDTTHVDSMIPMRMEYEYKETHLRWGRLPIELCIPYTTYILRSFLVPLHSYYLRTENENTILVSHQSEQLAANQHAPIYYYKTMMELYRAKYVSYIEPNMRLLLNSITTVESTTENEMCNQSRRNKIVYFLRDACSTLQQAIDTLFHEEANVNPIDYLPPVVCHMDLQPQNLLFASTVPPKCHLASASNHVHTSFLVSVLDWEETAYADLRFELLLLCRKVCANSTQAECIWQLYPQMIQEQNCTTTSNATIGTLELGSIVPWLKLETVHSITTLLLQCLAGGVRGNMNNSNTIYNSNTPIDDEQQSDIYGKVQREFQRLNHMGWSFCDTSHWQL
jgi:thiamine kinase-like enzyme